MMIMMMMMRNICMFSILLQLQEVTIWLPFS